MAALLGVINVAACDAAKGGSAAARSASSRPGGSYRVPAPGDLQECKAALGSHGEFIVDVHTHHVMPRLPWRTMAPATLRLVLDMVPADCTAASPLTCVDGAAYLHDMFLASDTTVALLSDLPSTDESNDPLPFTDAEETRQLAHSLTHGGSSRLLLQNVVAPNFGSLRRRLDGMTAAAETKRLSAFKAYTAWGPRGRGFHLDDPAVGLPVLQHARLGLSGGAFPRYARNLAAAADPVTGTEAAAVSYNVQYGGQQPSALSMPILSSAEDGNPRTVQPKWRWAGPKPD